MDRVYFAVISVECFRFYQIDHNVVAGVFLFSLVEFQNRYREPLKESSDVISFDSPPACSLSLQPGCVKFLAWSLFFLCSLQFGSSQ
jgi:hypothetical protein